MTRITLCGSTRFPLLFEEMNARLTLEGNLVYSVGFMGHQLNTGSLFGTKWDKTKEKLDAIHKSKIEWSDTIYVLNPLGYIGESTASEIDYAERRNKEIRYLDNEETSLRTLGGYFSSHFYSFVDRNQENILYYIKQMMDFLKTKGFSEDTVADGALKKGTVIHIVKDYFKGGNHGSLKDIYKDGKRYAIQEVLERIKSVSSAKDLQLTPELQKIIEASLSSN